MARIKTQYITLLKEVLSWPTGVAPGFDPDHNKLEDFYLFRAAAIGKPVVRRNPDNTKIFKPLKGALLKAVKKESAVSPKHGGKCKGGGCSMKTKKKIRMYRDEDTIKKDQLERGIESTWSTQEAQRVIAKKNTVVV